MKTSIWKSRKFWAALVGLAYSLILSVWPDFPIPEGSVFAAVASVVSYILGTALEDGLRGGGYASCGECNGECNACNGECNGCETACNEERRME